MDKTLLKDEQGLIRTGQYTSVNQNYATPQALDMARTFATSQIPSSSMVITPDTLASQPAIKLSPTSPAMGHLELGSSITSLNDSEIKAQTEADKLKAETVAATTKAQTATETAKKGVLDFLGFRKGEQ